MGVVLPYFVDLKLFYSNIIKQSKNVTKKGTIFKYVRCDFELWKYIHIYYVI